MIKFGTGGFRGVIGEDFTKHNVQLVVQALCDIIREDGSDKPVAVGYDYRFGSGYFAVWIAETLAANGVKCLLYTEPLPSPAVMTAVRDEALDYGIMITASHNPYYFNGVKVFVRGGMDADVAFTDRLERATRAVRAIKTLPADIAREKGLVVDYSNKQKYLENITAFLSPAVRGSKVKILYDNLCGVGASCIRPLFEQLGVKNVTVLHAVHDAFFGFVNPNPTREAMQPLAQLVRDGGYDFAMATDSDSDRLGIIDENGRYVTSNEILACLYYYLINYRGMKGDAVKNCATSVLVDKVARAAGFECHEVDVGFKNISAAIKCHDALIGGESSGGLTVRGYIFGKDSVFSSALFAEMVTVMNMPVSAIVREVCEFAKYDYACVEDEIRFGGETDILERILENPPEFDRAPRAVERIDKNIKYRFDNECWALIRLSGTEPVCRAYVECETADAARRNLAALDKAIRNG